MENRFLIRNEKFAGLVLPAAARDAGAVHQHILSPDVLQTADVAASRGSRARGGRDLRPGRVTTPRVVTEYQDLKRFKKRPRSSGLGIKITNKNRWKRLSSDPTPFHGGNVGWKRERERELGTSRREDRIWRGWRRMFFFSLSRIFASHWTIDEEDGMFEIGRYRDECIILRGFDTIFGSYISNLRGIEGRKLGIYGWATKGRKARCFSDGVSKSPRYPGACIIHIFTPNILIIIILIFVRDGPLEEERVHALKRKKKKKTRCAHTNLSTLFPFFLGDRLERGHLNDFYTKQKLIYIYSS